MHKHLDSIANTRHITKHCDVAGIYRNNMNDLIWTAKWSLRPEAYSYATLKVFFDSNIDFKIKVSSVRYNSN